MVIEGSSESDRCPERGATLVEYALVASLIMVVCTALVGVIGGQVNLLFLSYPN